MGEKEIERGIVKMGEPKDIFMLCESIKTEGELFNLDTGKYKANYKFDGERVIAVKKGEDIVLFNRLGNIITYKFSEVVNDLRHIPKDFMIDGEIISMDNDFNKLQRRALTKQLDKIKQLEKEIPVKYMIFDIISIGDNILMRKPLRERLTYLNELLDELISDSNHLELVEYGEIKDLLNRAIENDGEGIVVKNMEGEYESRRSRNWFKYKLFKETTITITSYTENNAGIRVTDEKGFIACQIAGFQSREVKELIDKRGYCNINIQYLSKSNEGKYRFPSYRGIAQ